MSPARVLLVDDAAVIRGVLSRFVDAEPDLEVVGTAANGRLGVDKVRALDPDVVVMDVEMPEMNGVEALREIRTTHPRLPVIMFSTLTGRGAKTTLDALAAGASDYATKPSASGGTLKAMEHVHDELIVKIRGLVGQQRRRAARSSTSTPTPTPPPRPLPVRRTGNARIDAVVVGSSTGGPVALERVLSDLPVQPVPVLVVQHMPPAFTSALAERLDRLTPHEVLEGADGMVVEPGRVLIAPGGHHMRLVRRGTDVVAAVGDGPLVNSCRPSVEPLFESAATVYGANALVVMLTGMGRDGTDGTGTLAELGAHVIAQDEDSSVVWGMPGSVVEAGLASEVLPLDAIGRRIAGLVDLRGKSRQPLRRAS